MANEKVAFPSLPGLAKPDNVLKTATEDFERLKKQKAKPFAGIEARCLLNLAFVNDEQYVVYRDKGLYSETREPNKLYLQFNLITPRLNKLLGRLSSADGTYKSQPTKDDPQAKDESEVVDAVSEALDQKLDETSRRWERLFWMAVAGTAIEFVGWVPDHTTELMPVVDEKTGEVMYKHVDSGELFPESFVQSIVASGEAVMEQFEIAEELQSTGEVGSEIISPLNFFIDQSVKSLKDLGPDQFVYLANIRTTNWVKDTFGVEVDPQQHFSIVSTQFHPSGPSSGGLFLKDMIPLVQGSADDSDPPMVTVVQGFSAPSKTNPQGRYICFIPGQQVLHDDVNPYGEIPFVDFHWQPVTTSFWTRDFVTSLIAPQRFINKRYSQLGEQANATLYSSILLGDGLDADDIPADFPGVIKGGMTEGKKNIGRLEPPELPQWFMMSLDGAIKMFNDVAGGADLFGSDTNSLGQMRGSQAVPAMQEILDTQWGPLFQHIGERTARVKEMRLNRVKQFYPPTRTLHYVAKNMKDEVLTFHADEVLRSGTSYNVRVERSSLIPELRALREARVIERLSGPLAILYMDERSGRIDKSKVAADLHFGDASRESREAEYRKLGAEAVARLKKGQPIPPVMAFYDHGVMLDELEAFMGTTEYWSVSPQIQQLFAQRYEEHRMYLQQEAMMQQQMMMSQQVQGAVAQATQQAAATAAAKTVESSMDQMSAQRAVNTDQLVRSAAEREAGRSGEGAKKKPTPAVREMIIREKSGSK